MWVVCCVLLRRLVRMSFCSCGVVTYACLVAGADPPVHLVVSSQKQYLVAQFFCDCGTKSRCSKGPCPVTVDYGAKTFTVRHAEVHKFRACSVFAMNACESESEKDRDKEREMERARERAREKDSETVREFIGKTTMHTGISLSFALRLWSSFAVCAVVALCVCALVCMCIWVWV